MSMWQWIEATLDDEASVLVLMEAFYCEEHLVFVDAEARSAIRELLSRDELGRIFLLKQVGHGKVGAHRSRAAHGHLVLTWGFSLEFRGRYVLLDELFVSGTLRGRGYGKEAIEFAARWARERGAAALRLEVNHANAHAREVYARRGFADDRRDLMTRWT